MSEKVKITPKAKVVNVQIQTDEIEPPKTESVAQTILKETVDKATSSLFLNIPLEGNPTHSITCLCMCHETITKCEVQLFKHTSDTEEAVESMYYKEDYDSDEYPDYEIQKTDWRPLSGAALKARLRETGLID